MRTDIEVRRDFVYWKCTPVADRGREVIAGTQSIRLDDYLALLAKAQDLDAKVTEV